MKVAEEIELTEEEIAAEAERAKVKKGELVGKEKSWKDMAEVRMVMYVVPVAIIIAIFVYFINQ
jgi:hypothetical protein